MLVLAAVLTIGGCTLNNQTPPPLAGPSGLALSITVTASPDVITQDGQAQSQIGVLALDANSQPVRGLTLRLQTQQGGNPVNFGTLSSTQVSTGGDGRAAVTFTAPPAPPPTAPDSTVLTIVAIPVGNNFQNTPPISNSSASIKLMRPGAPLGPPPTKLTAAFTFSPNGPKEGDNVQFDASTSSTDAGDSITGYAWTFGDGATGSGVKATHAYSLAGQYTVGLTVTDARGFSATATLPVSVGTTALPVAAWVVSPTTPIAGTQAFFNASGSKASDGHTISSYAWDFGDGTTGSGVSLQHTFALPGGYNVTLVITDDTGRTGSLTQTVSVATSNPTASFTVQPQTAHTTDIISLDATASSAVLGRVIVTYAWQFSGAFVGNANGAQISIGPVGGVGGTLTIKLTVTDSAGQIGILTKVIQIQP